MIDLFFEDRAERWKTTEPGLAADTSETTIEHCWKMMKRGILRLYDPEADDDDGSFIHGPLRRASKPALASWAPSCTRSAVPAKCKNGPLPNPTHQSGQWNADTSLGLTKS
jgi:hypothetical protein